MPLFPLESVYYNGCACAAPCGPHVTMGGSTMWLTGAQHVFEVTRKSTEVTCRCRSRVQVTCAGHVCRSRVQVTCAGHVCRSRVQVTCAGHVCKRRLWCAVQGIGGFTLGDAQSFFELTSTIPSLGSTLNFDADVKKLPHVTHCENC